jgi:hypothetical protein
MPNPTERFSNRVDDYVRYRPTYPPEVIDLLTRACRLTPQSAVADLASGTCGSLDKIIASLHEKLMTLPDDVIVIPGHGPLTNIGEERQSNPFLK